MFLTFVDLGKKVLFTFKAYASIFSAENAGSPSRHLLHPILEFKLNSSHFKFSGNIGNVFILYIFIFLPIKYAFFDNYFFSRVGSQIIEFVPL